MAKSKVDKLSRSEARKKEWVEGKRNRKFSFEHRRKISEAHKGKKKPWARNNPQTFKKGLIPWNKGTSQFPSEVISKRYYAKLRKLKLKGIEGKYTYREWEELKRKFYYTCPMCGKKEPEIKLTPDHIIPVSKEGTNYINNIQPLCLHCNCVKNDKIIFF